MNLKDKLYLNYCPSCDHIYSINYNLEDAEGSRWKHYWKGVEGHVKEEDIVIKEYESKR
jgi:hypothetical protein